MEIKSYEDFKFEDNKIGIDDVSITYLQNSDCTENQDDVQSITISCRNNGAARFLNIKTENWSLENIDEMVALLKDFEKRAELCD